MTLFVTGTDTGVGKTAVCAALVLALKDRGIGAGYMKPLASGCARRDGDLVSTDAEFVRTFCGLDDPSELICPVRLEAPLAPLAAAQAVGTTIDLRPVYTAWRRLKQDKEVLVVEGVGGLLVPISDTLTVASLVSDWGVPCLVVARPSLGTINHTLLTLYTLASYGVTCPGFVFGGDDEDAAENAASIARFSGVPFQGGLPSVPGLDVDQGRPGRLAEFVADLDLDAILAQCHEPTKS